VLDDGIHAFPSVVRAALYTTLATFVPSVRAALEPLRGARARMLWHGSWFSPPRCAFGLFTRAGTGEHADALVGLLAHARDARDPWNAYYNAQGTRVCRMEGYVLTRW